MIRIVFLGFGCIFLFPPTIGGEFKFEVPLDTQVHKAIMTELSKPILLKLKNGGHMIGHSIKIQNQKLLLGTSIKAGEARSTFNTSQVKQIQLPGKIIQAQALRALESQQARLARGILERLYYQRVNLLPLLPEEESQFFIAYAQAVLDANEAATALGICKRIQAQLKNKHSRRQLQLVKLQCYNQLQLYKKLISLATKFSNQSLAFGLRSCLLDTRKCAV